MAWIGIGTVGGLALGATGLFMGSKGNKNKFQTPTLPTYYEDPMFQDTQKDLLKRGKDISQGDLPDYYKIIGQSGSPEFEGMLRSSNADIERASLESAAKTGQRGGAVGSNVAGAVGRNTAQLRWQDIMRSIEGKQFLFGTGIDTISGVRSAAGTNMANRNNFNLGVAGVAQQNVQLEQAEKARKAALWNSIISGGMSTAGTIAGSYAGRTPGVTPSIRTPGSAASAASNPAFRAPENFYLSGGY